MILFLLKYRKLIGYGIAVLLVLSLFFAYRHSLIKMGREQGRAQVQALWDQDKAAWLATNAKIEADALAKVEAAKAQNAEVLRNANESLVSIAGERDSVERLLQSARDQVRSLVSAQATSQRGIDVATRIAASAAEVDRRLADYDSACRRDAVRFQALQDQIRGQL